MWPALPVKELVVDINLRVRLDPHSGQTAVSDWLMTSTSPVKRQSSHSISYIGMVVVPFKRVHGAGRLTSNIDFAASMSGA